MKNFKNESEFIRRKKSDLFVTVAKSVITDNRLTSDAKLLLISLLNNSDDYVINIELEAIKIGLKEFKKNSAIKNLKDNGYLSSKKIGINWKHTIREISNDVQVSDTSLNDTSDYDTSETCTQIRTNKLEQKKKNKQKEKNVGVSTGISTGEKIENLYVEQTYYSDSQFECETTTSTPTPIFEYKEEKKKDDIYIQRESFKQKARTLYRIQLLGLIDSTFPQNIDEKTNENRNTFHSFYSNKLNEFQCEIDKINDIHQMNELYSIFQQIISSGAKKMADFQLKKETIENTKKEHNCSDSTAEKVYLLFKEVIKMGGTSDCIRFKNKVNRIVSKADGYRSEWIQNDAKEVVADPNLQTKF